MRGWCPNVLLVAVTAAVTLAGATDAVAAQRSTQIRLVNRIEVDLRGSDYPSVRASLSVTMPARQELVGDLASPKSGRRYRGAVRQLLDGLGVYGRDDPRAGAFRLRYLDETPRTPRPRIRRGRARVWTAAHAQVFSSDGAIGLGLWSIRSRAGRLELRTRPLTSKRGFTVLHVVRVHGAGITSVDPVPERAVRGQPLRWRGVTPVTVKVREPLRARAQILANSGAGPPLRAPLYVLTVLLPALMLARGFRPRRSWRLRWSRSADRDERRLGGVLACGLLIAAAGSLNTIRNASFFSPSSHWISAGVLVGLTAATAVIGVRLAGGASRRRAVLALAASMVVVLAAIVVSYERALAFSTLSPGYDVLALGPGVAGALAVAVAVAVVAMALMAIVVAARRYWPHRWPVWRWTPLLVAVLASVLTGQWVLACYSAVRASRDQVAFGYAPDPYVLSDYLTDDLVNYLSTVGLYVVDFLQLVLLAVVLCVLRARVRACPRLLPDGQEQRLLVVLFAALVGGSAASLISSYAIPITFAAAYVALAAVLATTRGSAYARAVQADARSASAEYGGKRWEAVGPRVTGLFGRLRSGFLAPTTKVERAAPTRREPSRGGVVLGAGPEDTWWDNGVLAVRRAAWLALVPAVHYIWVAVGETQPFSATWGLGGLDLLWLIVAEYAFWFVGAFVFGALYVALPGTTGFVKGLVPTGVFAFSQAAAEVLPGTYDFLAWPFLVVEVGLFFVILGVLIDFATLRKAGMTASDLGRFYAVDRVRLLSGFVSPVVIALFFFLQQLITGDAEQAVTGLLEAAAGGRPGTPN